MTVYDPSAPGVDFYKPGYQLLIIKSATVMTGQDYRWSYEVKAVNVGDDALDQNIGFTEYEYEPLVPAVNVLEFANTDENAGGYDPDNIPDDFNVLPVSGYVLGFSGNAKIPRLSCYNFPVKPW